MPQQKKPKKLDVMILVASDFDEEGTIKCIRLFRQAGLATEVISHKGGLVTGANGLAIRPDRTLTGLEKKTNLRLIIIPGKVSSAMSLLIDPRVHRLFAEVIDGGGYLAVMSQAEEAFLRAGLDDLIGDPGVVGQGQKELTTFCRQLTDLLGF